jgi:hypothetical protein
MRLITRLRTASLLNTIWYQPTLLKGMGTMYEHSFESLLHKLEYDPAEFQRHPRGANRWPDFHLHLDGEIQAIELKTTHSNTVCMGGTWPHPDCIYIIGHLKAGINEGVTIVRGDDLATESEYQAYETRCHAHREMLKTFDRIESATLSVQIRTNLWIKLMPEKRDDWYQRVLQTIMCK